LIRVDVSFLPSETVEITSRLAILEASENFD
jgi:hypothetical protein